MITVMPLPAFQDNYLWLLQRDGMAAVVDPGDGAVVQAALQQRGLKLVAILVTHHHADHVGGLPLLTRHWQGVPVLGPRAEAQKIPGLTRLLDDGDRVQLPELELDLEVLAVPGHTLGHIAYHEAKQGLLFCGDTLFAGGCGRLFEGTPRQMYGSLQRLAALDGGTRVYCAHEYTLSNLDFARAAEPGSDVLRAEIERVQALRARGEPSVPSTVERERRVNPFLRAETAALRESASVHAGQPLADAVGVFTELRRWKDGYKSAVK